MVIPCSKVPELENQQSGTPNTLIPGMNSAMAARTSSKLSDGLGSRGGLVSQSDASGLNKEDAELN